jgi:cold shock CspA family protein/ribosome-associated translation inhibitor RaiA
MAGTPSAITRSRTFDEGSVPVDVPPEIAFRNVEPTEALHALIREGIDSLEKVHPRLTSCRVMVEANARGFPHVRIDVGIPGSELVVHEEPAVDAANREVQQVVREAFDIARRQLREHRKRLSLDSKRRELPPHGRIVRLVMDAPGDRYGFLLTGDGRQIYFHENAVREVEWDELEEGMEVRFVEAGGKEGPQASVVAPLTGAELSAAAEDEVPLREGV